MTTFTNLELLDKSEKSPSEEYFSKCQVDTPGEIVKLTWDLVNNRREKISTAIDFGAGDGRFSNHGNYEKYLGIEFDEKRIPKIQENDNVKIIQSCAFETNFKDYDLCIGNPPFVRHHDVNKIWYKHVCERLSNELGFQLDLRSNAFLLFLAKAITSTKDDGLISLVIPYEWVSRPSAKYLRDYISFKKWAVDVYRLTYDVFPGVLTTASITIIDKSKKTAQWTYYKINKSGKISRTSKASGTNSDVIPYSRRKSNGEPHAQRGLSPGGQKIFCLTEGERIHFGLKVGSDVIPCISTLKHVPYEINSLDKKTFKEFYIDPGIKCWLILPNQTPSEELAWYIKSIPEIQIDNYTCRRQNPWWCYKPHLPPDILYGSGFTSHGPKFLSNAIKAIAVGSTHGIHNIKTHHNELTRKLKSINFEQQIVSHSGKLKKVEVGQMNTVLGKIYDVSR